MKSLFSMFAACVLSLTAVAQDWKAPAVPGENLSGLSSSTTVYLYNVEADAFVTNGMDWNTNACATRLNNSDTKASEQHRAWAYVSGQNVSVRLQAFADQYISCPSKGAYDIYVDQTKNQSFRFAETATGSNVYTLTNTALSLPLDVVWNRGGHLTLTDGAGLTHWAFISETHVTDGSYARYKWQQRLYSIYEAIVAGGKAAQYSAEIAAAKEVYDNASATNTQLQNACKTLFTAAAADIAGPLDVSFLFTNADMAGVGLNTRWNSTAQTFSWGDFEKFHGALTLTQSATVPAGVYDAYFRSIYREDGSTPGKAPVLTAKSDNTVTGNVPLMTRLNYLVGNANSNGWAGGEEWLCPNDMKSAAQALCHPDAQAVAQNVIVSTSRLTVSLRMGATSQWLNWQGMTLIYKGNGIQSARDDLGQTIAAATALANEGGAGEANLRTAISTAQGVMDNNEATIEQLLAANQTLLEAMETYRTESVSVEHPIDWSDRLTNRSFEQAFTGWEQVGMKTQSNTAFGLKAGNVYVEKWTDKGNRVGDASVLQTVKKLGLGVFVLKAAAHNIQEGSTAVQSGAWIVGGMEQTAVGKDDTYTLVFTNIERDATIGFKAVGATGNWLAVDNFELYWAGGTFADYQKALRLYIEQAESVLPLKMEASIRSALETSLANARAELAKTTADGYTAVSTPLRTLKQDAEVSSAAFARLQAAIDKAEQRYGTGSLTGADKFLAAINQAKAVNDDLNSTQAQMAAEIENLERAYRLYMVTNGSGTAPVVKTDPRYARGCSEAFGRMTVTGNTSNILEQGFCYSETNPEPTVLDLCGTDYLDYNGRIYRMPMKPATVYYIRAYAMTKTYAVGYGDVIKMSTLPQGDVTYTYISNGAPVEQNDRITAALEDACRWWTNYTSIRGFHVTCNYSPGTPTADCGYGGGMRMGTNMGQRSGTCLHEMQHGVGCGTLGIWGGWENSWLRTSMNGDWAGERANAALRFWENRDDLVVTGAYDNAHWGFRPFSGVYEEGGGGTAVWENKYAFNGAHLDAGAWAGPKTWNDIQAVYIASSAIVQGMMEDGLVPVNYWGGGFCLPAYVLEQDDNQKYYIKNENKDCGLYDSYLVEQADGSLAWKAIDQGDLASAENAAWYVTFTGSNQCYQVRNASTGHYVSYTGDGAGGFKARSRTSVSNNENFHVIRGRNAISVGNESVRSFWFIHPEQSNAPHAITANADGTLSAQPVNLYDSGETQRWILLRADEVDAFEQGVKKAFQADLKDLIAQIRRLKRVGHTEDVANADQTLETALTGIETQSKAAVTAADVRPLVTEARTAAMNFLSSVTPTDLTRPFDLTFMMDNAAIDSNLGWSDMPTFAESCCEYFQRTFDFYQTLTNLPKGTFRLTAQAFQRPGAYDAVMNDYANGTNRVSAQLYMDTKSVRICHIGDEARTTILGTDDVQAGSQSLYIPNTMVGAAAYFKKGLYENEVLTSTTRRGATMRVGLRGSESGDGYWTIFDNFHLYFYGSVSPDVVTGISEVVADHEADQPAAADGVYDLQGRRVADTLEGLPRGIYLVGGHKVMVP
ncbi:MAG: hypothetical protein IKG96_06040 [Bacteroidaceae bacterium]|nr:hypothetical protein [Bacteroidaceae bacterium]